MNSNARDYDDMSKTKQEKGIYTIKEYHPSGTNPTTDQFLPSYFTSLARPPTK
jgi:hypothetical protein